MGMESVTTIAYLFVFIVQSLSPSTQSGSSDHQLQAFAESFCHLTRSVHSSALEPCSLVAAYAQEEGAQPGRLISLRARDGPIGILDGGIVLVGGI